MKRKWIIAGLVLVLLGLVALVAIRRAGADKAQSYETAVVRLGGLERTITSSGKVDPVGSVDVGTQVSGTVVRVYVDFNDTVAKGQVVAELDRTFLQSALEEAQASLVRSEALYEKSRADFERNRPLRDKGFLSEEEFARVRTEFLSQKASVVSAQAAVRKARSNLDYATIRSPVAGVVIKRSVEVGQTVAASLSAPTLFVIAEDLRDMEILAQVDENDIGAISVGQKAHFSVQAYADRIFEGVVRQIRLQPEEVQNVVTYTVVVSAPNPDGRLMPGMTATVDFVAESVDEALLVPTAALRFRPDGAAGERNGAKRRDRGGQGGALGGSATGSVPPGAMSSGSGENPAAARVRGEGRPGTGSRQGERQAGAAGAPESAGTGGDAGRRADRPASVDLSAAGDAVDAVKRGRVWVLGDSGSLRPIPVRVGPSDGTTTAILGSRGDELREGIEVVTGEKIAEAKAKKSISLIPRPTRPGGRSGSGSRGAAPGGR